MGPLCSRTVLPVARLYLIPIRKKCYSDAQRRMKNRLNQFRVYSFENEMKQNVNHIVCFHEFVDFGIFL